jgi:tetratricopeptide (TPR) repeat protein
LTERTLFTEDSHLLGTPEYMSPEQAEMVNEDIDTRSDIYSLGVLLYVLLAGILPYDSKTFREGGVENIRRVIRETDPKTPSTRLTALGQEAAKIAEMRGTEVSTLARHLKKELEWIPLKAMRKERSQRYRSASELADDIENYLKGAPLIASPLGAGYKVKKFVRRNRVLVGGIAAVLLVSLIGTVVSTIFAVRAEYARSHAQAVSDFLLRDVLDAGRDGMLLERTLEDMLENATKGLEGKFNDQPLVEAEIRYTLGQKYLEAFNPEPARLHLERAYQIRVQQFGPEDERALQIAMMLGWVNSFLGRNDEAIRMWAGQIETIRRAYGDGHRRIMLLMTGIGDAYGFLGDYEEAEACLDEALKRWEQLRNPSASTRRPFGIQKERGENYLAQGRFAEAEQALGQALELKQPSGVRRLECITVLSAVYREQGRYAKAQQLCQTALDTMREDLGDDHYEMLNAKCELGRILTARGLLPEAQKLLSEALRIKRLKRSLPHENAFSFINALAVVRTKQGEYADANDLFAEALKGRKQILGENHPETLETLHDFGVLRREQKNCKEAEEFLRRALDGRKLKLGPDHPACFESMHELAVLYKEQARYEEAEEFLLKAVEGRRQKLGDKHPHTLESINNLIALYEAWNKPQKAEEWRPKLPQRGVVEE